MASVKVVHWNPRTPLGKGAIGRRVRIGPRVKNFGDLLGPIIVEGMRRALGVADRKPRSSARVLCVGSIVHLARTGDIVWGAGVNGHALTRRYGAAHLDVRAVRGPLTRDFLLQRGYERVPAIYGDPALLLPQVWPHMKDRPGTGNVTFVPNLNDPAAAARPSSTEIRLLDPRSPLEECVDGIVRSAFVIGSSLHAIILAEAFGVPARVVVPHAEPDFKYRDYYAATGRSYSPASTVDEALSMGGAPPPAWDPEPLRKAFPVDVWS